MACKVVLFAACGMSVPHGVFDSQEEALKHCSSVIGRKKAQRYTVETITELRARRDPKVFAAWEFTEPEDAVMVPDDAGVLEIIRIVYECRECGCEHEEPEAAFGCCSAMADVG